MSEITQNNLSAHIQDLWLSRACNRDYNSPVMAGKQQTPFFKNLYRRRSLGFEDKSFQFHPMKRKIPFDSLLNNQKPAMMPVKLRHVRRIQLADHLYKTSEPWQLAVEEYLKFVIFWWSACLISLAMHIWSSYRAKGPLKNIYKYIGTRRYLHPYFPSRFSISIPF